MHHSRLCAVLIDCNTADLDEAARASIHIAGFWPAYLFVEQVIAATTIQRAGSVLADHQDRIQSAALRVAIARSPEPPGSAPFRSSSLRTPLVPSRAEPFRSWLRRH